ncbi:HAD family phosphatase [Gilvibacter sp.]|uniref:HAD family hydrolase n=1 Tax=Gilvibacter sp. TaxID=2729997 RepID=UPI0025B99BC9|nr:HAD family phosphatase [Gilvibacter sp.]NQX78776.1 HAD family phosphatase [Gilvibacter sp.]
MKNAKAVLFDMDGVIIDSEPLHHEAYFKMFEKVGIEVSDELYESFTGRSTKEISDELVSQFNTAESAEELTRLKRMYFYELFDNSPNLQLIDGVRDAMIRFHESGLKLVVASSASMENIKRVFNRFELDQYFVGKISGADLPKSKPHPEIFQKAAQMAGHKPEDCFVIEDATNGIKAAKAAGIYCYAFNSAHSTGQDYRLADSVITSFSEIDI